MRVSVFGLGYVGCVTAACLAQLGHTVIGVDVQTGKVEALNRGHAPVLEPGLDELVAEHVRGGKLRATMDVSEAVAQSELALVCVGTPSRANGSVNLDFVERVAREIAAAVRAQAKAFVLVIRSTCPPGTLHQFLAPRVRAIAGDNIVCAVNPEFMREGSAVRDFFAPPFVLIGAQDAHAIAALQRLYAEINAPQKIADSAVAEAVKYASNAFHAVKVVFANEIGRWCASQAVDSRAVMELVCADRALNVSEKYLTPGFAFGGSCLPKDVRALLYQARHNDVELPLLHATLPSNELHLQRAFDLIAATGKTRIAVLGLAFKAGTDDVRESPMVLLVERLLGKGYAVTIHDPQLSLARVVGANRAYLQEHIPHIASLLVSAPEDALAQSDVIAIGQQHASYAALDLENHIVIDLIGALSESAPHARRLV